jgi:hypothetical protein
MTPAPEVQNVSVPNLDRLHRYSNSTQRTCYTIGTNNKVYRIFKTSVKENKKFCETHNSYI